MEELSRKDYNEMNLYYFIKNCSGGVFYILFDSEGYIEVITKDSFETFDYSFGFNKSEEVSVRDLAELINEDIEHYLNKGD